jgi:hypothetical protein
MDSIIENNYVALLRRSATYLGIAIALIGLGLLVYMGFYNRYWSDDWCYNVDFKNIGVIGAVNTYFLTEDASTAGYGYSPNRYSLTLLAGVLYMAGITGAKISALLVIILWLIGLTWVIFNMAEIFHISYERSQLFLITLVILFFTLYYSPQRFQVLYWVAGIHYSFSIITGLYLTAFVTQQMLPNSPSRIINGLAFPLAFIAGGFSETGCAFLISAAAFALLMVSYGKLQGARWATKAFPTLVVVSAGLVAALVALIASPSNVPRLDNFSKARTPFTETIILSLRYSLDFMIDSIKSAPLPHLIFFIALASVSIFIQHNAYNTRANTLKLILQLAAILLIAWLLISAIQAPTVYVYKSPPDPRGKSLASFVIFASVGLIAWITCQVIALKWRRYMLVVLALLGLSTSIIYMGRAVILTYSELPAFMHRAELWDQRDITIKQALAQGINKVEVVMIDMGNANTRDIVRSSQIGNWISNCGSRYYGLEAIKGVEP